MADAIAGLPNFKRALILSDVQHALERFDKGDRLELPSRCELVRAIK